MSSVLMSTYMHSKVSLKAQGKLQINFESSRRGISSVQSLICSPNNGYSDVVG